MQNVNAVQNGENQKKHVDAHVDVTTHTRYNTNKQQPYALQRNTLYINPPISNPLCLCTTCSQTHHLVNPYVFKTKRDQNNSCLCMNTM